MHNAIYSDIKHINIGREIYQLQSVNDGDSAVFMIRRSGELMCVVSMNENGEWQSDNDLSDDQLADVVSWIKKLYK